MAHLSRKAAAATERERALKERESGGGGGGGGGGGAGATGAGMMAGIRALLLGGGAAAVAPSPTGGGVGRGDRERDGSVRSVVAGGGDREVGASSTDQVGKSSISRRALVGSFTVASAPASAATATATMPPPHANAHAQQQGGGGGGHTLSFVFERGGGEAVEAEEAGGGSGGEEEEEGEGEEALPPQSLWRRARLRSLQGISEELHDTSEDYIADFYPSCSVFFSDIVGFTTWSAMQTPQRVFQVLETMFSIFDECCKRHGCFKVRRRRHGRSPDPNSPLAWPFRSSAQPKSPLLSMPTFRLLLKSDRDDR